MPSVFNYYRRLAHKFTCVGKADELIHAVRRGRTESSQTMNNVLEANFQDNTSYSNGDLVTDTTTNTKYLIVGRQNSNDACYGQLRKINATLVVQRLSKHFTGKQFDGYYTVSKEIKDVASSYRDITGKMQQWDQGLLASTTIQFVTQMIDVELTDRIVFNGGFFIVNYIDSTKYEGLYAIQCSPDNSRKVMS